MTSRPEVNYNANGEVTMDVENGVTVHMRFSPDIAEQIATRLMVCADSARKAKAKQEKRFHDVTNHVLHESESAPPEAFGHDAWTEKDGLA